jgi:hypothetical protein
MGMIEMVQGVKCRAASVRRVTETVKENIE